MFERFTDRARKIMALANQEAQRLNHEAINPEHILLGLVKEGSGIGFKILSEMGIDLPKARRAVEDKVKSGTGMVAMGVLPQTPKAKLVIETAIKAAREAGHNYVGSEHIALGLSADPYSVAGEILFSFGVTVDLLRTKVLELLKTSEDVKVDPISVSVEGKTWTAIFTNEDLFPKNLKVIYDQIAAMTALDWGKLKIRLRQDGLLP